MQPNLVTKDYFPKPSYLDKNGKQITDTLKLQELDNDLMKGLLFVSSTDFKNIASFNLAKLTLKTGDIEQYFNFSKSMQLIMAKQEMVKYDTCSSVLNVDNIKFQKFITESFKTNQIQYSGIYLAKIKEYFLVIKVDYIDKLFGQEIEKAILMSTFE
jgi:hypothetical protein